MENLPVAVTHIHQEEFERAISMAEIETEKPAVFSSADPCSDADGVRP